MKKDVKKLVELQINGENIQIEKKKIKNMYLRISPANGEIRVSAPERMSVKTVEGFVRDKWKLIMDTKIIDNIMQLCVK